MTSTVVLVQCLMTQKYSWHLPYIPSLNLTGWKIESRRHWYWNNGNKQLPQNIEERRCSKTVQQHLHVNQTRIRLRLLQPLLHSTPLFARTKRNTTIARPDADAEVESYLSDTSTELSSLEAYPDICQVT